MLLEGPVSDLIPALVTVILGMVSIAAGLAGYFFADATRPERAVLIIGGVMMVYPSIIISLVGMALAAAVVIVQIVRRGRNRNDRDVAPATA